MIKANITRSDAIVRSNTFSTVGAIKTTITSNLLPAVWRIQNWHVNFSRICRHLWLPPQWSCWASILVYWNNFECWTYTKLKKNYNKDYQKSWKFNWYTSILTAECVCVEFVIDSQLTIYIQLLCMGHNSPILVRLGLVSNHYIPWQETRKNNLQG